MTRSVWMDAVLLRSIDYRDADRIVTLLTPERGIVSALARGARSSRRRFAGALEPYALLRVDLSEGRGELGHLREATIQKAFVHVLDDLGKITAAGHGLSIVRRLVAVHEPDRRPFDTTTRFLAAMDDLGRGDPQQSAVPSPRELLVSFALRMMSVAGVAPRFDACAVTGRLAPAGQSALFDPSRASIVSRAAGGGPILLDGATREALMQALTSDFFATRFPGESLTRAEAVVEQLLSHHFGKPFSLSPVAARKT